MSSYLAPNPVLSDAPNWLKLDNEGVLFWALGRIEGELVPENELWLPGARFDGVTYGLWRRPSNSANLELSKFLSRSTWTKIIVNEIRNCYHIIFCSLFFEMEMSLFTNINKMDYSSKYKRNIPRAKRTKTTYIAKTETIKNIIKLQQAGQDPLEPKQNKKN